MDSVDIREACDSVVGHADRYLYKGGHTRGCLICIFELALAGATCRQEVDAISEAISALRGE